MKNWGITAVLSLVAIVGCVKPYTDFGIKADAGFELMENTSQDKGDFKGHDEARAEKLEVVEGIADAAELGEGLVTGDEAGEETAKVDQDGDGYIAKEAGGDDCDDTLDYVHPGAEDPFGDGVDQDCDGVDGKDTDGDGYIDINSGGDDCDDNDPEVHPGASDFTDGACSDLKTTSSAEFVDTEGNTGYHSAAAVTDDGTLFVAYRTKKPKKVMLAVRPPGGKWSFFVVYEGGGQYISLALAEGAVHITFYDDSECKCLRYAVAPIDSLEAGNWVETIVDDDDKAEVGRYSSVRVDSSGHVHVAYWDKTNNDLKYATNASGKFIPEVVSGLDVVNGEEEKIGKFCSLALDSEDKAHIAAWYETGASLAYVTNKSGKWERTIIDEDGQDVGKYTSIGVDSKDKVHIAYRYSSEENLRYATNSSGSWKTFTIDGANITVGSYIDLAIDKDDNIHISYNQGDKDYLRYATNKPGKWIAAVVHSEDKCGLQTSIALTPDGAAHIFSGHDALGKLLHVEATLDCGSYGDSRDLNCDGVDGMDADADGFASIESGGPDCDDEDPAIQPVWVTSVVDPGPNVGEYASLAIDKQGVLHASYYAANKKDLMYARLEPGSNAWQIETVDDSPNDVGKYSSVAVSEDGEVHIAYYDSTASELHYATNASGNWLTEVVEGTELGGDVGKYASIAVDKAGVVHIAYHDETEGLLRYATGSPGNWQLRTIPNQQHAGRYTSITTYSKKEKGKPVLKKVYIAYQAIDAFDLMLAEGIGDDWSVETIDAEGDVGEGASIAIDDSPQLPEPTVHVAYRDSNLSRLNYATRTKSSWSFWMVDDQAVVGKSISLALDSNKMAHIVYKDQSSNDRLCYATNVVVKNGQWTLEPVVGTDGARCGGITSRCGKFASLVFDPMGSLRVVYYDEDNKQLLYSRKSCLGY